MQTATKERYASGFPKEMIRTKSNLPSNNRLKTARKMKGLSLSKTVQALEEKGVKLGMSTLQGYEAPEDSVNHRYPSLKMLLALANLYEVSTDYILGITDHMNRPTNDMAQLFKNNNILWNEQRISQEQKNMIIYKANQIMTL